MVSKLLALLLAVATAHAAELEGVRLDDRVNVDGQALELNGMAGRTRYFFKVYVAGLYLPARVTSAERAIEGDGAKRLVLVMMRDASGEQFCESIEAGLANNQTPEELDELKAKTEALFAKIRSIGEV